MSVDLCVRVLSLSDIACESGGYHRSIYSAALLAVHSHHLQLHQQTLSSALHALQSSSQPSSYYLTRPLIGVNPVVYDDVRWPIGDSAYEFTLSVYQLTAHTTTALAQAKEAALIGTVTIPLAEFHSCHEIEHTFDLHAPPQQRQQQPPHSSAHIIHTHHSSNYAGKVSLQMFVHNSSANVDAMSRLGFLSPSRSAFHERVESLRLFATTFNLGNSTPPHDLSLWLPLTATHAATSTRASAQPATAEAAAAAVSSAGPADCPIDLFVIGTQECDFPLPVDLSGRPLYRNAEDAFICMLAKHLPSQYERLAYVSLRDIRLAIFIRASLAQYVSDVNTYTVATGIGNVVGNKGGTIVSFRYRHTRFAVLNCHLAAHQERVKQRNADLALIFKSAQLNFPAIEAGNVHSSTSNQLVGGVKVSPAAGSTVSAGGQYNDGNGHLLSNVHHCLIVGDLNYRLNWGGSAQSLSRSVQPHHFDSLLAAIHCGRYGELLSAYDQLREQQRAHGVLAAFQDASYDFPPTFKVEKFIPLAYSNKRLPAFCDRILHHTIDGYPRTSPHTPPHAVSPLYVYSSDHKPVYTVLQLQTLSLASTMDYSRNNAMLTLSRLHSTELDQLFHTHTDHTSTTHEKDNPSAPLYLLLTSACFHSPVWLNWSDRQSSAWRLNIPLKYNHLARLVRELIVVRCFRCKPFTLPEQCDATLPNATIASGALTLNDINSSTPSTSSVTTYTSTISCMLNCTCARLCTVTVDALIQWEPSMGPSASTANDGTTGDIDNTGQFHSRAAAPPSRVSTSISAISSANNVSARSAPLTSLVHPAPEQTPSRSPLSTLQPLPLSFTSLLRGSGFHANKADPVNHSTTAAASAAPATGNASCSKSSSPAANALLAAHDGDISLGNYSDDDEPDGNNANSEDSADSQSFVGELPARSARNGGTAAVATGARLSSTMATVSVEDSFEIEERLNYTAPFAKLLPSSSTRRPVVPFPHASPPLPATTGHIASMALPPPRLRSQSYSGPNHSD